MTQSAHKRGGAPVGYITDLDAIEAASVVYLRLWNEGSVAKSRVLDDFNASLGTQHGQRATRSFEELCSLCARFGRRPLMRHAVTCKCLGADEACFANFIATAAEGDRDDTLLIATLFVRTDMAPLLAGLATDVGLALKRMNLASPRTYADADVMGHMQTTTVH